MRTLELNKTQLWYVNPLPPTENVDADGFLTGEMIVQYTLPQPIKINIYPSNGAIMNQIFGEDVNYDKIAISNEIDLNEDALLFLTRPDGNYDKVYDFKIASKVVSINTINYGLRSRT